MRYVLVHRARERVQMEIAYECQRSVEDIALASWDPEWLPAITAPIIYEEERVLKAI